jgi:hypothetical protein
MGEIRRREGGLAEAMVEDGGFAGGGKGKVKRAGEDF